MSMMVSAIDFPVMAKKADVEQVNFRLSVVLMKRVRRFCESHPFKPSMTTFADVAFTEYLDKHEPGLPSDPPPAPRRHSPRPKG